MKILQYAYNAELNSINVLFKDKNIAFIDIETDGLSHKNKIVLIGLVIFSKQEKDGIVLQLFNDDYQSERELLQYLFELLEMHDINYYISFNGDSFDFPFINARIKALKLNYLLDKKFNIDLLRVVRKNKALFPFESYTLKSVERFVGIDRTDTISGKDSVILYHNYIENKDPHLESIILLHNYDDIINMVPLLKIYDNIPFQPLYPSCTILDTTLYIISTSFKNNICEVVLGKPYSSKILDYYYETIGASLRQSDEHIIIKFEISKLKLKDSDQIIFIVNTSSVFKLDFTTLSQDDKQSYLIAVDQNIHWQNLTRTIKKIYRQFIED